MQIRFRLKREGIRNSDWELQWCTVTEQRTIFQRILITVRRDYGSTFALRLYRDFQQNAWLKYRYLYHILVMQITHISAIYR